jgi:hypothetical protein
MIFYGLGVLEHAQFGEKSRKTFEDLLARKVTTKDESLPALVQ